MMKNELYSISEAYSKVYESGIGEPLEHKNKMVNLATELATIAYRVTQLKVRKDDGDRLMDIAKQIEAEYKNA